MESMKQRMLGGKLYKANDPEISVESQRGSDLVWQFNHLAPDKKAERATLTTVLTRQSVIIFMPTQIVFSWIPRQLPLATGFI